MKIQLRHTFEDITSVENLLAAWQEFVKGKRGRRDVQEFSLRLMDNIFTLHADLRHHTYRHGGYQAFAIHDPKPREIHKASVRDRLLHHAVHRALYPFFDRMLSADSHSCRIGKGTHKALDRFREFCRTVSKNDTRTCLVLKCDVKKFFASVDQRILVAVLGEYVADPDILWLLRQVIESFSSTGAGKGLPLGNLTSQLFVNIYMNEFDRFMKHMLKTRYYIRYADDFVIFSENRRWLQGLIPIVRNFLWEKLRLELHPKKTFLETVASGIDFLGWVHFPEHRVLRTTTKRRMMKRLEECSSPRTLNSYLGLLGHGNAHKIKEEILERYFLRE